MAKDFNHVQVVEHYDQHIRKLIPGYELIHLQVQAVLKHYLPENAEILIVGCGTGYELQYLIEHFPQANITAIDPAENMLIHARQHLEQLGSAHRVAFIHADSRILKQYPEKFDVALAILVSHFVPIQAKFDFFQDIMMSLKAQGLCLSYDLTTFKHQAQRQLLKQLALRTGLVEAQANAMLERLDQDFALISAQQLQQLYFKVGFSSVEQFAQVFNYVGLIAFKNHQLVGADEDYWY